MAIKASGIFFDKAEHQSKKTIFDSNKAAKERISLRESNTIHRFFVYQMIAPLSKL